MTLTEKLEQVQFITDPNGEKQAAQATVLGSY